jgi:hypothetical protein
MARPRRMPAAVPEAGLMTNEDMPGAKEVAVRAARRRMGDPLPAVVCTRSPSTPSSLMAARESPTVRISVGGGPP